MSQETILNRVAALGVVPVIAIENVEAALPLADALLEGGLPVVEITFRAAAAAEVIRRIARERPQLVVGAGTVLTAENLKTARASGAAFGVAPGLNPPIVREARQMGLPFVPGVATPSDIERGPRARLQAVEVFPRRRVRRRRDAGGVLGAVSPHRREVHAHRRRGHGQSGSVSETRHGGGRRRHVDRQEGRPRRWQVGQYPQRLQGGVGNRRESARPPLKARMDLSPQPGGARALLEANLPADAVGLAWLGQAGFVVRAGGQRLLIDPYLSDHLGRKYAGKEFPHIRLMPPPVDAGALRDLDLAPVMK